MEHFNTKVQRSIAVIITAMMWGVSPAQSVLFDFDSAPLHVALPLDQTAGGITAHFAASGEGFSIQEANTMGFTPAGFGGYCIYPSSVFAADLFIRFDQPISAFSLLYACQELGCDDAATMRVTAYAAGTWVGTATRTASVPGTWPTDTLSCAFATGFDSVVVHYDSPPPTCQDYGVIFMADNLRVTAIGMGTEALPIQRGTIVFPNPVTSTITIDRVGTASGGLQWIEVYDATGRIVHRTSSNSDRTVLDLSGLPRGSYWIRLTVAGRRPEEIPIVLQ